MSSWFGSIISSLTGSATPVPNFDFHFKLTEHDPDTTNWTSSCGTKWVIRNGTKGSSFKMNNNNGTDSPASSASAGGGSAGDSGDSSNNDEVSIFSCELSDQSQESLVRNVMKKARAFMLPGVLRCLGTAEHNGQLFIATDKCISLKTLLAQKSETRFYKLNDDTANDDSDESATSYTKTSPEEKFHVAVAYGINTISNALSSLHKNRLFHGSVNIDSIFVLQDSGEWRLFGFEYATTFDDLVNGTSNFNTSASRVLHAHRLAPEAGGIGGGSGASSSSMKIAESAVPLLDSWGLGILLFEVFHYHTSSGGATSSLPTSVNELRAPKCLPRDFLSSYNVLVANNAKLRWTPERFHNEAEIIHGNTKIVRLMTELDNLTLKDNVDRDTFYRELATCVDTCPSKLATGLILPKIANLVQYGGCSAAALIPLLRVARKLSTEAFASKVAPSVLVMFNSNEPLVRMKLLENAELYAPLLPEKIVCNQIWPLYQGGLNSKIPEIRELSIRSLVHFAPVLTERFTSGDVVKALLALQQDSQGVIRTNATICLGMLARFLPSDSRGKTLCNGFGRMLKDPYAPSRAAAVRSISSLAEETFSAQQICEQLLPALSPILLDTDKASREAATTCVQKLVTQAVSLAHDIPCAAPQPAIQQNQQQPQSQQQQQPHQNRPTTHAKSFSSSSANNTNQQQQQVSTPITAKNNKGLGAMGSSNSISSQSLDITPLPKKPDVFTTKPAAPAKSKLLTKGWDNNDDMFTDDDEDQDQGAVAKKNDEGEFNLASSPAPVTAKPLSSTSTTSTMSSMVNKKKDDGDATTTSLNATATSLSSTVSGGGMKLGAPKKRGFGVKKNTD